MWRYNSEMSIYELFCHWYCWLSSYMQGGIAGAVNTNCTCENKLAQIGPKSQHACFFFNEGKRRRKLNVFSEILNIQAPLFWSERMTILFCNMLRTLNMTNTGKWYKFYGMLVSDKYFFKAFLDHEHVKMKNTDSTWNIDGISRKQAKTTDRTCECTYTEGPSILGIRLLVRVLVIGLDPGPSLQNHWTGRISSAWITLPYYVWF